MTVLSTHKIASGLGFASLGAVAIMYLRKSAREKWKASESRCTESLDCGEHDCDARTPVTAEGAPKLKTRVGNYKISKVKRLGESLAEDFKMEVEFDWDTATNLREDHSVKDAINTNDQSEWENQVNLEQQTFLDAARIVGEIRKSGTHRKLPHFHVVDRQLSEMEAQFREFSEDVLVFPWRESRNDPMSRLMELPLMQLAQDRGLQSLLPVSQGYVKQTAQAMKPEDDQQAQDEALLGITAGADRQTLDSAFRHKARRMHANGHCIMISEFHALNNAYGRCIARLSASLKTAYSGGGDILAHYLLIGLDPSESRYREVPTGLLDALGREKLLMKTNLLRLWNEDERCITGLGQG